MKTKALAVAAFVLVLALAGFLSTTARKNQQELSQQQIVTLEAKEKSGRINLKERVQLAKAKGKEQLIVPGAITNYSLDMPASPEAANQLLPEYTVVIAQLAEKKSYIPDEGRIGTWNKFRVIDTISQARPQPSYGEWSGIPDELLPTSENDILVHTTGGNITVDGVEVTQNDLSLPAFKEGGRYILVLSVDPTTRIGEMRLGLYSTLPVAPDDVLDVRNDNKYLQQVLKNHHAGSIQQLKSNLKERTGSR